MESGGYKGQVFIFIRYLCRKSNSSIYIPPILKVIVQKQLTFQLLKLKFSRFVFGISLLLGINTQAFSQHWLWAKNGNCNGLAEGNGVAIDNLGNVYITGSFSSPTITFGTYTLTSTGGDNVYLVKYNSGGNILWATSASGTVNADGNGITTDDLGNVYITGQFASPSLTFGSQILNNSSSGWNFFLVKYNSAGTALWAKSAVVSSSDQAWGKNITTDGAGNVYVTGYFGISSATFGNITLACSGSTDIFIVKYDSNGNVLWAKSAGGAKTDLSYGIATDNAGNVYIDGVFASVSITFGTYTLTNLSATGTNIFFTKYDSTGNVLWAKGAGGTNQDWAYAVATDKTGNVYITGGYFSPTVTFGSYTITHTTNDPDIFIVKYDSAGNALWVKTAGGISYDNGYSVTTDISNNVYLTGGFSTTSNYAINFGSFNLPFPSGGTDAMFIVKFDSTGNVLCGTTLASGGDDVSSVAVDTSGNAYVTGDYLGSMNIGSITLPSASHENIFTAKFTCRNVLIVNVTSTSVCTGAYTGTATATPTSGTSPFTYSWNTTPIQTTQTATGLCAGNYQVIVKDAALTADTLMVTVSVTPPPTALITGTAVICKGQNTTLTASGGGSYLWNTNAVSNAVTVSPISDSIYSVIVSNNGCSDTARVTINVNVPPIAAISGSSIICSGQNTILTASGSGTYSWNTGAASAAIIVAPMASTPYTVIVTNSSGCSDTASQIVTVNTSPIAVINGNNTICIGQSTILTAGGGTLFNWNTGANSSSISVAPIAATTYGITVTNASGCTDTASHTVAVNTYPIASITGNAVICKGNNTALTASGGATYLWNTGETTPSIIISPLSNSIDSVIVSNGPCSDTVFINIAVNNTPTAHAGTNTVIVSGDSAHLNASGGGTYSWFPTNGLSCINCANPIASPSSSTYYCVTVTNNNGCTDSACIRLTVENPCDAIAQIVLPNAFSPNNDGHNDVFTMQGWKNCVTEFHFVIYDRWGEKVFESTDPAKGWDGTFNGSLVDSGVLAYYITALNTGGEKIIRKGNISLIR